jgi:hypothetical protein
LDEFLDSVGKSNRRELTRDEADKLIRELKDLTTKKEIEEKVKTAKDLLSDYKDYLDDLKDFSDSGEYEDVVRCYEGMKNIWAELGELEIPPAFRWAAGIPSPGIVKMMYGADTAYNMIKRGIKSREEAEERGVSE